MKGECFNCRLHCVKLNEHIFCFQAELERKSAELLNTSNQLQGQLNSMQRDKDMAQSKANDLQTQLNDQLKASRELEAARDAIGKELDQTRNQLGLVKVRRKACVCLCFAKFCLLTG